MTKKQAEILWRRIGRDKLLVRQTLGWESDEALAALRPMNVLLDAALEVMSQRRR